MTLEPTPQTSTGKKIGYVRVSDTDQTEDLQVDALKLAGCDVIYGDHGVSGAIRVRKGLDEMLTSLEAGDTLVVWKLDRLGRSTIHLLQLLDDLRRRGVDFQAITQGIDTTTSVGRMLYGQLAVFAEFEREQIRERTKAGMAAAKARGKHIGRPRKLTEDQIAYARRQLATQRDTVAHMATSYGVAPITLSRAVKTTESDVDSLFSI
ncbi:recombinase family protein [Phaeobacter piscinae]|uniref:Integrases/recombinase n=1 Tax=Phaeobacter piscinae TaxID=1580596 RepID=A0AAN1GRJ7_9RHOB|nr:recombinase family protein [Phaeobacter piscinae]ATG43644.1 putative integrases/recombinase [Phaeobacter piscinae]